MSDHPDSSTNIIIRIPFPCSTHHASGPEYAFRPAIRKILPVLFILSCLNIAYAQNDYRDGFILTLQGDTLTGMIDYRSNLKNYESCLYKSGEVETEYFPDQILGFAYSGGKYFSSQIVDGSFVEVLVRGELSLYKTKDKYLIEKKGEKYELEYNEIKVEIDGKQGFIEDNRWRGLLSFLIHDCYSNSNELISSIKLEEKDLTRLVVKYNKCRGADFTEYKMNKPWTHLSIGTSFELSGSMIRFEEIPDRYNYLDHTYYSLDPTIGIPIAISSPRIYERVFFQSGIQISKSGYSSLVELENAQKEYHDTYINLTTVSIPLSIKYAAPERNIGHYFEGGVMLYYHTKAKTRLLSEIISGDVVNTFPEEKAFEIYRNQIGFWAGFGLYKSFHHFIGATSIGYHYVPNLVKTEGLTANTNLISIKITISTR